MATAKTKTLEEMPIDELRDAMANYEQVSLKITRRNEKGQIATVYSDVNMTLEELLVIDGWLKANAGGGRFRVEARNPADKSKYIVQPFHVGVEGMPRPPRFLGNPQHQNPQVGMEPQMNPYNPYGPHPQQPYGYDQQPQPDPYGPPAPPWAAGLHPSQRGGYARSYRMGSSPAPGATVASDQLAIRQMEKQEAEKAAQIAKLEAQNQALLERLDRQAEEAKKEREEAREERHRAELRALEARMEALAKPQETKSNSSADLIAALAPFAPVLATMISSNKEASSKSLEVQQQGLTQLMQATLSQANKPDSTSEMIKTFLPMAMPLIQGMMENKSPAAQAQLFNSMVENNLNSVAMMAQLIEAFAGSGDQEPWWLPMVRETMTGVVGMTEAYMQGQGGLPGQLPQPAMRPLPEPHPGALPQGQPAQPGASAYSTVNLDEAPAMQPTPTPQPEPQHAPMGGVAPAPTQPTAHEMEEALKADASPLHRLMLTQLPPDFQTPEWRIIALALHQTDDVEEVANFISGHVSHLMNFGLLPAALLDIEEDPARALDRVMGPLPISKENPKFAAAVLRAVITALVEDGFLEKPSSIIDTTGEDVVAEPTSAATA